MSARTITIGLAGNPNSGKTTIFNALTGSRQHVGNYPGVTVEKKQGSLRHNGDRMEIVDLPGTYSLTAVSDEELVSRNFILEDQPELIVDILDSSNLERNLYLAIQLRELGVPVVLVLNMFDIVTRRKSVIDLDKLSKMLSSPVVTTIGNKKKGIDQLRNTIAEYARSNLDRSQLHIDYGQDIEQAIEEIQSHLDLPGALGRHKRWTALKLLENDSAVVKAVHQSMPQDHPIWSCIDRAKHKLATIYADSPEILIADRRYGFIAGICQEVLTRDIDSRRELTDHLDTVMTHPILGLPIFLGLMYVVFYLTFTLGELPMGWLEEGFGWLGGFVGGLFAEDSDNMLKSLLVDGVISGVGGVVVFLPNILLLFLAIAFLEDTGYMARAAFIMDRFMHKIGLHGKSFIPMLIGFGCSVPAIMGTRILENRRDRMTTLMIVPLMSCGARLTIYALLIPAFFPRQWQAPVLWIIYIIGIALAAVMAKALRLFVFKGESEGLVMELPPYRVPTLKGLLLHMWHRGWMYLRKAGTIILAFAILLWALSTYPQAPESELAQYSDPAERQSAELSYTVVGRIGRALEPAIKPLGFDWRIGTALVSALPAKEIFVAQMGIVFSVDADPEGENLSLREKLQENYTPFVAFCIMIFCLISAPCVATLAITRKETNSWFWAITQFVGLTLLAYVVTLVIYQVGSRIIGG